MNVVVFFIQVTERFPSTSWELCEWRRTTEDRISYHLGFFWLCQLVLSTGTPTPPPVLTALKWEHDPWYS